METVTSSIDLTEVLTSIVSPVGLVGAAVLAVLILTGLAGRMVLWFERISVQRVTGSQRSDPAQYGLDMAPSRIER
jgi:hypothetical protein